jgi:protein ImuB
MRKLGDGAPPPDDPLILKGATDRRRVITALNDQAQLMGLHVGMPVAKAEALFSGLRIMDADLAADAEGLEKLSLWALRLYSPIVRADPPAGLVLDITGAAHLYGGEAGLIRDARRRLRELGVASVAALADSWGAAHALARFSRERDLIVPEGRTGEAILGLPVAALRLQAPMIEDLRLLGIDTIGELASKPRAPLAHRFGQFLWRRVDQAFGRVAEPIEPVDCPELVSVRRIFAEPIGAPETLEKYTRRLTDQICDRLEERGEGARRLDLHYVRVDNRIETITVAMAQPVREPKRLAKLLCDKIETVDPGFGIDKMILVAAVAKPLVMKQVMATYGAPPKPDVEDLWDTLENRHGRGRLYRAVSVATDIPERSVKRLPPTSTETGSTRNAAFERPERLIRPEPIQALAVLPDHPPRAFSWRRTRYQVIAANGPERVKGEWWHSDREVGQIRDYFILETDSGERFWVFRAGDGQHDGTGSLDWYMHGLFR